MLIKISTYIYAYKAIFKEHLQKCQWWKQKKVRSVHVFKQTEGREQVFIGVTAVPVIEIWNKIRAK